jgi:ADP-ribose pyrophosphatase YjhB (NUDIX family)
MTSAGGLVPSEALLWQCMSARTDGPVSEGSVTGAPVPCVGAVITDGAGRLLLIQRGHDPGRGLWSIPGGRVEDGETDAAALARETLEETGLVVTPGPLAGTVTRPGPGGSEYLISDYAAVITGGTLAAGDDAADVRWATPAELDQMEARAELSPGLLAALRSWGAVSPG